MRTRRFRLLIGAALIGGTMMAGAGAQAYWDDPRGGPWSEPGWESGPWFEPGYPYSGYGPGFDRTHERQNEMRDHRAAMRSVARMLSGRRSFDRAEAIGLARAIEASAGANLVLLFKPSDWRGRSLSRARIGDEMETFIAYAEALREAAGELADELEKQPSTEDVWAGRAWSPDWRPSRRGWGMGTPYSRWEHEGGAVTTGVFDAYRKLRATCHGCHANFRSPWR